MTDHIEARDVEPGDTIDGILVVHKTEGVTARRGPFVDLTFDMGPHEEPVTIPFGPLTVLPNHCPRHVVDVIDVEAIDD